MKINTVQTFFFVSILIIFSCSSSKKTSPYEFALMSADVYDKEEVPTLPPHIQPFMDFDAEAFKSSLNLDLSLISDLIEEKNWKKLAPYVIGKLVSKGGYSGRAYFNTKNQQLIIAHRGTDIEYFFDEQDGLSMPIDKGFWETLKDLDDNLDILKGNIPEQQLEAARYFTKTVKTTYQDQNNGKKPTIIHTGHSLGAVLAELSAVDGNTEAVTFESPGTFPMIQKLIKRDSLMNTHYKIVTYNTLPNSINMTNPPAGKVIYLMDYDNKNIPDDALDDEAIKAALSKHSIREVLVHFDPKTGKPRKK